MAAKGGPSQQRVRVRKPLRGPSPAAAMQILRGRVQRRQQSLALVLNACEHARALAARPRNPTCGDHEPEERSAAPGLIDKGCYEGERCRDRKRPGDDRNPYQTRMRRPRLRPTRDECAALPARRQLRKRQLIGCHRLFQQPAFQDRHLIGQQYPEQQSPGSYQTRDHAYDETRLPAHGLRARSAMSNASNATGCPSSRRMVSISEKPANSAMNVASSIGKSDWCVGSSQKVYWATRGCAALGHSMISQPPEARARCAPRSKASRCAALKCSMRWNAVTAPSAAGGWAARYCNASAWTTSNPRARVAATIGALLSTPR